MATTRFVKPQPPKRSPLIDAFGMRNIVRPGTATAAKPAYTMGPSGFATNAQGAVDPNDPAVRAALERSQAANPNATMGPSPNVDYGSATPTGTAQKPVTATGWESDPILAQIRGMATRNIAGAESGALAARQQAMTQFGYDPSLQGSYTDAANAAAAQQNPFSTLAQLGLQHATRARTQDEQLNQGNLFYSGARSQAIGDEARQYLGEQAGAQADLQSKLSAISTSLLAARQAEQERQIQGEQDAYNRDLQFREQYGIPGDPAATGAAGAAGAAPSTAGATPAPSFASPAAMATRGVQIALPATRAATTPAAAALAARSAALNARYGLGKPTTYRGRH